MQMGFAAAPGFSLAQGRGGYDQFGEYVEENVISDEAVREAEQKRLEGKLVSYREKLKNNPKDTLTHFLLGNLYAQMNRPKDAILAYEKALKLNPWNGEAHYNLARAYDAVRDGPSAVKHVRDAIKIFRENLYIHWQTRARQLLRQLQKQYGIQ